VRARDATRAMKTTPTRDEDDDDRAARERRRARARRRGGASTGIPDRDAVARGARARTRRIAVRAADDGAGSRRGDDDARVCGDDGADGD